MAERLSRVVVTGSSGFVGRVVVAELVRRGFRVVAVDRRPPDRNADVGAEAERHTSDLEDPSSLLPTPTGEPFALAHLAWDMDRSAGYGPQVRCVALLAGLLDYWTDRGLEHLVGVGSAAEYGDRGGRLREDDAPGERVGAYGWAKRSAHDLAEAWSRRSGRDLTWLRPFLVYGSGQAGDMMLPYAIGKARRAEPAEFTDGLQERDFVHVRDVAGAIVRALETRLAGPRTINVGTGEGVPVRRVLGEIARRFGAERLFAFGRRPRRPDEPPRQVADTARAEKLLDWRARIDWRKGIADMCQAGAGS